MKTYFLSDPIENVWNYENMKTFFPTQLKIPRRVWKCDSFLFIHPPQWEIWKYENLLSAQPNWGGRDQPAPLSSPPEDQRKILRKKRSDQLWNMIYSQTWLWIFLQRAGERCAVSSRSSSLYTFIFIVTVSIKSFPVHSAQCREILCRPMPIKSFWSGQLSCFVFFEPALFLFYSIL